MANIQSSMKRIRSSRRRAQYNQVTRSTARTYVKKARTLIAQGNLDEAALAVNQAVIALAELIPVQAVLMHSKPRSVVFDPDEVGVYHCWNRLVQRRHPFRYDWLKGKDYHSISAIIAGWSDTGLKIYRASRTFVPRVTKMWSMRFSM